MFRQYRSIKTDCPDAILLFRMGDFYEMFYEDAKVASRALELTLTSRGKGTAHAVPMCGFPHHQLDQYAARLVRKGHRVAVCDQVEDPRASKGLVKREIVRVLTPGTVLDPAALEAGENHWAAAVAIAGGRLGAAFVDVTTGEFLAWDTPTEADAWEVLAARLQEFSPREIVHPEGLGWPSSFLSTAAPHAALSPADAYVFQVEPAQTLLQRHFAVASLDGFGLRGRSGAIAAAGGLLLYLQENQKSGLEHLDGLACHDPSASVGIDAATRRNLELDRSLRDGARRGSLIQSVDATRTAAGARLLRSWLLSPLKSSGAIRERLDAVEEFVRRVEVRERVRDRLDAVHDIERLVGRTVAGAAGPREMASLRTSLARLPEVLETVREIGAALVRETVDGLDPCADVADLLARGIVDDPPVNLRDGGVIRDGFDGEIDDLRSIRRDGKRYIASLEARERDASGIGSLKVKYNRVFGYFIEVSKANLHLVPETYVRKQTIANGERFVTPELKDYESKVLSAQEKLEELESERFVGIRSTVAAAAPRLKAAARAAASIDVLAGLAETAVRSDHCRPDVHEGSSISIRGGRHPVVERSLVDRKFVPNDAELDAEGRAIAILTGPNMGGKSTYLRQVALIVLLAQSGAFVPAESASIGIVDRIFCRVGASDNLAEGQSTFMVEMAETANILHHATPRSLVLLDEIGRGTATFDGLSIAWAVVEHLHGRPGGACRTLFATHYHELTELAVQFERVFNVRMAVRDRGDGVLFTHRVEPGAADRSYGIHVARLAGVPAAVVRRAEEILHNLETDAYGRDGLPRLARTAEGDRPAARRQASLFPWIGTPPAAAGVPEDPAAAEVLAEIRGSTPESTTPIEALRMLDSWQRRLRPGRDREREDG